MGRQMLFYGFLNLFLGIALFAALLLFLFPFLDSAGLVCTDNGLLSCGGLQSILTNVAILISIIGIVQVIYWAIFEREKEEVSVKAAVEARSLQGKLRVCPQCHMTNDPESKFCSDCGSNLSKTGKN